MFFGISNKVMGRDLLLLDLMVVILHKKSMLWLKEEKRKIAVLLCIICNGVIYIEKLLHTV